MHSTAAASAGADLAEAALALAVTASAEVTSVAALAASVAAVTASAEATAAEVMAADTANRSRCMHLEPLPPTSAKGL
jgi:hypothetical protein